MLDRVMLIIDDFFSPMNEIVLFGHICHIFYLLNDSSYYYLSQLISVIVSFSGVTSH